MTRFWISLEEGIQLVIKALKESRGGETFISKIPSFKVTDLATAMAPNVKQVEVGIREGEKLHECMVPAADSLTTFEYEKNFVIFPHMEWCNLSELDYGSGKKFLVDSFMIQEQILNGFQWKNCVSLFQKWKSNTRSLDE